MIAAFMHALLTLQGDSTVVLEYIYGTGMWAYVKRIIYTLIYVLYTICDEIMKGQKKGKCFSLSALV